MMKILVTDGMDRNAINYLINEGFEVEEKFYEEEDLKEKIKEEKQNDEFVVVPVKKEITIKFNIYDKQLEQLIKFLKLSEIEYESEDL